MAIFDNVHYVLSSSIPAEQRNELSGLLDINGATNAPPHTHLIALSGSHTHHKHVESLHVVSEVWVHRSIMLGKLQLEQYYSPDPTMIFSGIVACATDIPSSDLEVLSAGITSLGGQWRTGLTRDVTHLFALHEQSDKYQTAMHFAPHTHMSVLTPHWFDDSVRLGRRVPEGPYLWPDPKILRPGELVPTGEDEGDITASGKRKRMRSGETGLSSPVADEGERRDRVRVWEGKKLLLSRSLELSEGHREAVEANIQRAGGAVLKIKGTSRNEETQEEEEANLVDECDVFVTRYRSGKAYFKAVRSSRPILIGNLSWMFHVDASGTLNDPHDSLLWYPVPRGGIPGFEDCEITVTNYTGAVRDYLKKLIQMMGAKFTPSMSQTNKVLVAGYSPSPKTQRAVAWSIPIVNHTWLEDCFIAWKNLTVGVDKYILFPPGVDFGKMLLTPIGSTGPGSAYMVSGGSVPGGRGVGLIDVDGEEQRDMKYRRETIDKVEITSSLKADGKAKAASSKAKPTMAIELKDSGTSNSHRSVAPRSKRNPAVPQAMGPTRGETTEVEDAINFGDDEGLGFDVTGDIAADPAMDIDQGYSSPVKSPNHQKTKLAEKLKKRVVTSVDDNNSGSQLRPRSGLVRKSATSDIEDIVMMTQGRSSEEESSAEDETPSKAKTKANGTSRKRRLPVITHEKSDSESIPPRPSRPIPGTSTSVKKGMKPIPKPKPKPRENSQLLTSLSDDDEIYARPAQNQSSVSKAKQSRREPPAPSSKAKEKRNVPTLVSSRSPSPPAKMSKTLKRRVSVLVPSPPNPGKHAAINGKGKSELTRTNSIRASAAEASTGGSKRGRPSLSKPTAPMKNKLKPKVQSESEPEYEDEILAAMESSSSRGVSRRSAANKATSKLRDEIMPDVMNFEKERKNAKRRRSSGLNDSFVPLRDEEVVEQKRDGKRRRVESSHEEDDDEAEVQEVVAMSNPRLKSKMGATQRKDPKRTEYDMSVDEDESSKGKNTKATQNNKGLHVHNADDNQPSMSSQETVRVMTTGIHLSDDSIKRLNKLGAKMTTRPNDCTHLVTRGIVRTEKFMCAIANSPFVLSEGWVNSSIRAGKLLPEKDFAISDPESERKWRFNLSASLDRAKHEDCGANLLKGTTFIVTPKVEIELKLLKAVVASAGGQVQTTKPTVRMLNANKSRRVISCPADQSIWQPLVEEGYTIYSTELVLQAILTQEIRWKDDVCIIAKPPS